MVRREWIDWSGPCLPAAAAWLIDQASGTGEDQGDAGGTLWNRPPAARPPRTGAVCDLRQVLCVVPGRRAARILLAQFIEGCRQRSLALVPPQVLTPGPMADALLAPAGRRMHDALPAATPHETMLAWMKALRRAAPAALQPLLPRLPDRDDMLAWRELAATFAALHEELAGAERRFTEIAETLERMERLAEAERWAALARLYVGYEAALREAGLIDRHRARVEALRMVEAGLSNSKSQIPDLKSEIPDLKSGSEISDLKSEISDFQSASEISELKSETADSQSETSDLESEVSDSFPTHIVLIGVTDLNAVQRRALALAGRAIPVTALIHAPETRADHFDALGCLVPTPWREAMIGVDDDQIRIVDRPGDQAAASIDAIAALGGRYAAEEITIGLGDAALAASIERSAEWAGLRMRSGSGRPLGQSGPLQLLETVADWLEEPRFAHFATLLRHPDLERWLYRRLRTKNKGSETFSGVGEWITLLDEYFAQHLQQRVDGSWLGDADQQARLKRVHDEVLRLLRPLSPAPLSNGPRPFFGPSGRGGKRRLANWSRGILRVLHSIYGRTSEASARPSWHSHETIEACLAIRDHLAALSLAPPALQPAADAATALRLVIADLVGASAAGEVEDGQIEMLGWLELHLDPAPALIIAGCNDGGIPEAVSGDAFLPDSLRSALGLMNNERRYARDAYLLEAIRHSRETLRLIAGRRTADGDPLTPSRLLLACDPETLLGRLERMTGETADGAAPFTMPRGLAPPVPRSRFAVPALPPITPPQKMSVSEFGDYLACPYRYALKRALWLESCGDADVEMDALVFGSLAHEVLCAFGQDTSINACADERAIERFLHAALDEHALRMLGRAAPSAARVQLARLRERLGAFARFQAQRCAEGWRIRHCEIALKGTVALDVPGQEPMPLSGKIDRIDQRERDGAWCIIDYKTGEAGSSPYRSHHGSRDVPASGEIEWKDLQLPLYRYLAERAGLGITGKVSLAYVVLPKRADDVELLEAEWTDAHLASALDLARQVVRDIRAGRFAINPDYPPTWDDFARICQTLSFGREPAGVAEADGDEAWGGA